MTTSYTIKTPLQHQPGGCIIDTAIDGSTPPPQTPPEMTAVMQQRLAAFARLGSSEVYQFHTSNLKVIGKVQQVLMGDDKTALGPVSMPGPVLNKASAQRICQIIGNLSYYHLSIIQRWMTDPARFFANFPLLTNAKAAGMALTLAYQAEATASETVAPLSPKELFERALTFIRAVANDLEVDMISSMNALTKPYRSSKPPVIDNISKSWGSDWYETFLYIKDKPDVEDLSKQELQGLLKLSSKPVQDVYEACVKSMLIRATPARAQHDCLKDAVIDQHLTLADIEHVLKELDVKAA